MLCYYMLHSCEIKYIYRAARNTASVHFRTSITRTDNWAATILKAVHYVLSICPFMNRITQNLWVSFSWNLGNTCKTFVGQSRPGCATALFPSVYWPMSRLVQHTLFISCRECLIGRNIPLVCHKIIHGVPKSEILLFRKNYAKVCASEACFVRFECDTYTSGSVIQVYYILVYY